MAFLDSQGGGDDPQQQAPSGPPPDPSPGQAAPAGGGGPVLAALARNRQTAPVSAPGPGNVASGMMLLKSAVDMMQQALPMLPSGSQQHRDVLKALQQLSRHLPQGAPTAGVQQTQLGDMLRNTVRNALMQRLMSQRGGGGAKPGAGGPGGAAPPPSTPLPGA